MPYIKLVESSRPGQSGHRGAPEPCAHRARTHAWVVADLGSRNGPDGYMLTNWHVVADSSHAEPDTSWVTMADQSLGRFADVVATSSERDIALIKVRGYQGPSLTAIDWKGTKARQGDPAALIGYPAGSGFARDRGSDSVRRDDDGWFVRQSGVQRRRRGDFGAPGGVTARARVRAVGAGEVRDSPDAAGAAPAARTLG